MNSSHLLNPDYLVLSAMYQALQAKYNADIANMEGVVRSALSMEVCHSIELLGEEMKKDFSFQQTTKKYLVASLRTKALSMKSFILNHSGGRLIQKRRKSPVIERVFETNEDIVSLFPGK